MSSLRPQDRKSLCRFTFADGRQCRSLRSADHPDFCYDHARKDSQARSAEKLASELSYFFSGEYLSACDLSAALGRLLPAVVRGDIKPKTARTIAYLAQTLLQTIHLAKHEYINAFGTDSWRGTVSNSVRQNFNHGQSSPAPQPGPPAIPPSSQPPVVAGRNLSRPGRETGAGQASQPAPDQQPGAPPFTVCHPEGREGSQPLPATHTPSPAHPARPKGTRGVRDEASLHAPAPQPAPAPQSVSSPSAPLPPTGNEFAQQLLDGRSASAAAQHSGDKSFIP